MPDPNRPQRNQPLYLLSDAAAAGKLIIVTCRYCRKCTHYWAMDLLTVLGARPALDPPFLCSKFGRTPAVDQRSPTPGDIGVLILRRPLKSSVVWTWQDIAL